MKILREEKTMIPKDVITLLSTLEQAGHTAYIVGGSVRDMLMQKTPHDWDITTSAKPQQVKKLFTHTYDTGILHGTVTVLLHNVHYEITTYRIESDYQDCRHPDTVQFVDHIEQDLSRRDFTINAIAYNPKQGFIDPYHGREDIKNKVIRSVREARERFSEDALRILRAIRFSAQLDFTIEAKTLEGIKQCKALLSYISKERIRDELDKMLLSSHPDSVYSLKALGLLPYIVSHNIEMMPPKTLCQSPPLLSIRLALLLQHSLAKALLKELKYDNQTTRNVLNLIRYEGFFDTEVPSKVTVKKLLGKLNQDLFDDLMLMEQALGKNIDVPRALKKEILSQNEPYLLSHLAITGNDLIQAGIVPGQKIGKLLNLALEKVIKEPNLNDKAYLIAYCMTYDLK